MKYVVIIVSIAILICFISSCTVSKDAKASAYTMSNCAPVRRGIERCENEEVVCYVLEEYELIRTAVYSGISCFKK